MSKLIKVEPEYIYVTIPAEYICVYHRILAMMADYGEEMLKDCKASCTDKNLDVIECFNMFNSAVAARKLKKDKLAETIIKYVKAKINQIYKGIDNSTSFVFPVDENGQIEAFVSCGELPKFEINPDNGELYKHKFGKGFPEHFKLGEEDNSPDGISDEPIEPEVGFFIEFTPNYEKEGNIYHPCGELVVRYNGEVITPDIINYYFDDYDIASWDDVTLDKTDIGEHNFKIVITYNNETVIANKNKHFNIIDYEVS